MGCSRSNLTAFRSVWSKGSTSAPCAHDLTGQMNSCEVHKVRVSFEGRSNSGDATVQAFYEYSNDGQAWDGPVAFGPTYSAAEGWAYGTSFQDLTTGTPATRRIWIRFGALVKNVTGTGIQYLRARIQLDFEGAG